MVLAVSDALRGRVEGLPYARAVEEHARQLDLFAMTCTEPD